MASRKSSSEESNYSISIPKFNLKNNSYTPILMVVLLIASFFLGRLTAQVEYLQKGTATTATVPTTAGQPAAPIKADVENGNLPAKGDNDAKVTIVEFSDFECPFCGRFYEDTLPQLTKEYIDTGKVKLYYRHFPLDFHPKAKPLAIASECANDQGKFWEMHDKIFENNSVVSTSTDATFKQWAAEIGLNTSTFNNCYDNKEHEDAVDKDQQAGASAGVSGTPTFYINGNQLVGAQPFAAFKAVIDQELSK